MSDCDIVVVEDSAWTFDPEMIGEGLAAIWPGSKVTYGPVFPGDTSQVTAIVNTRPHQLSLDLDRTGRLLSIAPDSDEELAEFVSWLLSIVPDFDVEIRAYVDDGNRWFALRKDLNRDGLLSLFAGSAR